MRKKVLHVINSLNTGGAEMLLVNSLAPGGLQEFTDNTVVYFQGNPVLADKMDKGVQIINLHYKGIFNLPATLLKLRKIIKQNKTDIVHTHLNPSGLYTHLACPSTVPQVHTIHTTYSMDRETASLKLVLEKYGYLKKANSKVILLSDFTRDDFLRSVPFKGKTFVLNNFVPDYFFATAPKEYAANRQNLKLVAAGRINEGKNFRYLLQVFSFLKNREIYLDIYGAGDTTGLENEIKEKELKIRLMGLQSNMQDVLPLYDLFIMPSKFEGFPLSVFEAMASGIPLMLSAIAPVKSVVKEHAIYFELDNAEAAAIAIEAILDKKTGINSMAKTAKAYAEQTVRRNRYVKSLLEIYDSLAG